MKAYKLILEWQQLLFLNVFWYTRVLTEHLRRTVMIWDLLRELEVSTAYHYLCQIIDGSNLSINVKLMILFSFTTSLAEQMYAKTFSVKVNSSVAEINFWFKYNPNFLKYLILCQRWSLWRAFSKRLCLWLI